MCTKENGNKKVNIEKKVIRKTDLQLNLLNQIYLGVNKNHFIYKCLEEKLLSLSVFSVCNILYFILLDWNKWQTHQGIDVGYKKKKKHFKHDIFKKENKYPVIKYWKCSNIVFYKILIFFKCLQLRYKTKYRILH